LLTLSTLSKNEKEGVIKRKQELEKILHKIFGLWGHKLIVWDKEKEEYTTAFKLNPPEILEDKKYRDLPISVNKNSRYEDAADYYNENTPLI